MRHKGDLIVHKGLAQTHKGRPQACHISMVPEHPAKLWTGAWHFTLTIPFFGKNFKIEKTDDQNVKRKVVAYELI